MSATLWRRDWVTPVCRRRAVGERAFVHAHNAGGQVGRLQLQPDGQSMGGRHCSHIKHIGVKACSCWRAARAAQGPARVKRLSHWQPEDGVFGCCEQQFPAQKGGSARSAGEGQRAGRGGEGRAGAARGHTALQGGGVLPPLRTARRGAAQGPCCV